LSSDDYHIAFWKMINVIIYIAAPKN